MKKNIISVVALLSMFLVSCSNDDITIEAPSTINVNAAGVIAPFTWQYNSGELETFGETFGSDYKLRLRALVYNDKGELVKQKTELVTNYNSQLKTSEYLSAGNYTVIGISDVVEVSGNSVTFEYWNMNGEEKLSELTLTDAGYIGLFAKVLGIAKNTLIVRDSKTNSIDVNLQPAGSLIYTFFNNRDALSYRNVTEYQLIANKIAGSVTFDGNGNVKINERNDGKSEFIIATTDGEAGDDYSYNFLLPMNNIKLWFVAIIDGEDYTFDTDSGALFDSVAGEEYISELSLDSDISKITTSYVYANKTRSASRIATWSEKWKNRINKASIKTK